PQPDCSRHGVVRSRTMRMARPSVTRGEYKPQPFEALHDLLPLLANTLDVTEVFQHLAGIAVRIIPHDEANLALLTEDGTEFHEYASRQIAGTLSAIRPAHCPLRNVVEPQLVNDMPGNGPYRAGVSAPVRVKDRPLGVLALLSHRPQKYSVDD